MNFLGFDVDAFSFYVGFFAWPILIFLWTKFFRWTLGIKSRQKL